MQTEQIILLVALCVLGIVIVLAAIELAWFYRRQCFLCPHCGLRFRPPVWRLLVSVNAGTGKIVRCPHCGEKEYMEPQPARRRK